MGPPTTSAPAVKQDADYVFFELTRSICPECRRVLRAAKQRNIRYVMLNTNGKRIANDDRFLADLALA
jgi:uncharacterized radical SAM superfamily Fe-S cluster-containing enzyme